MRRTVLLTMATALAFVCLKPESPRAQAGVPTVERGYTSLFNGKDLTGWKVGGADAAFTVVDGAIQANGAPNAAHLFYDGPFHNHVFTDFDLKLDVMAKAKSNGGVYVCTEFQPTGFP